MIIHNSQISTKSEDSVEHIKCLSIFLLAKCITFNQYFVFVSLKNIENSIHFNNKCSTTK